MKRHVKHRMTIKYLAVLLLTFSGSTLANAYVDSSKPFLDIKDVKQQAETWAVCAASYDIMSTIMEADAPARAKQLSALGNGAQLAVGMALVINDLDPDISLERFKMLWANSQTAMNEWPQTQLTSKVTFYHPSFSCNMSISLHNTYSSLLGQSPL